MTIVQYLCSVPPSPGALHSLSLCIHMLKAGRLMTFIQSICAVTVFCPQQDHKSSSSPYIKTSPCRKKQRAINHILTIQTDPNYPNPPISTMATETFGCYKDKDSDTDWYHLTICVPERKPPSWSPIAGPASTRSSLTPPSPTCSHVMRRSPTFPNTTTFMRNISSV